MKIKCEREQLLPAFQTVAGVVPARSPKEILKDVKLEVDGDTATLMATDLDVGIRATVPGVTVEAPGSALLSAARFGSILRESSDAELGLEADAAGTLIRGERSEFRLPSANPEEFPPIATFDESSYHEVPARLLKEIVRRTVYATDNESTRYALGGVLLEMDENSLLAVGTDGRRLARMQGPAISVEGHVTGDKMVIVPSKTMQLIERSLADADAEIKIAATSSGLLVASQRVTIYSRLVEGRFPKWRDVFPKRDNAARIELNVGPLHSAVRQAMVVTSEESRGVDFTFADGKLTLAGRTAEVGQSRVDLPIDYHDREITITLDPRFLTDFLRVLDPEKNFTLEITDAASAAVCHTDDDYGYVIMPLAREP